MPEAIGALEAAAQERKTRLAKLRSLKRKPEDDADVDSSSNQEVIAKTESSVTEKYLSGRNYDFETQGPKLGFDQAPSVQIELLEDAAKREAAEIKKKADEDAEDDKPLDLFKLQPKKPNWDLKRDLDRKLERLNVQTDNAIARIVRERIKAQKTKQIAQTQGKTDANGDGGEIVGVEGGELVEGVRIREQEEEEEARRERALDDDDGD